MTDELVTLRIDGQAVSVPKGTLIIRAAEDLGIEIPRFCDHPLLAPVAACRQCYVAVEGQRKLMTSCSTPVVEGMVVQTQYTNEEVRKAQESVLEFLLINHPLDCPICDRGGECPLQDQALAFGPGESRYIEAKRTYRKPVPLSPLVNLDRERCVLCARCTRFCDEISGDRFIELFDRGAAEQVSIAPGQDFASPFSGNTIQICPVGALTSSTYRFAARPFDLKTADSVCPHCACGCNIRVDLRRGEVVRHLARDNYEVNDAWLCDKGRFAFSFADRVERLATPLLREHGLEPVSFAEALAAIARWSRGKRVGFLAGGRLSEEDAYAMSKLARTAFATNDVDHRWMPAGEVPVEAEAAQASGMPVTYRDVERASAILIVGLDSEQELPILHLRIRKAAGRGARVFVVHPRRTRLGDIARHVLCPPGQESAVLGAMRDAGEGSPLAGIWEPLRGAGDGVVVLAGPRLGESPGAIEEARGIASELGGRFALLCRRAGDRGALRAGLHPRLLPGGRGVADDAARGELEETWGRALPTAPGLETASILRAAAAREIDVLFLVGVDPLRDFPDAALARAALENAPFKVVIDIDANHLSTFADVMLPVTPYLEKDAHYSDWEGRSQRLRPVRDPGGMARADWEIFQELSEVMGADMGFHSLDALRDEMGRVYAAATAVNGRVTTQPGAVRVPGGAVGAADGEEPASAQRASRGGTRPPTAAETPGEEGAVRVGLPLPDAVTDEDQLILFSYPLLVDEGRLSVGAEKLKQALEDEPFAEIHVEDAERLGLEDGDRARLRTDAGEAELPVRVGEVVAPGVVFVPYNQPGLAANALLSGGLITRVSVQSAAEKVSA